LDFVRQRVGSNSDKSDQEVLTSAVATNSGDGGEISSAPLEAMKQNRVVDVWELQRRVTLFHKTWQAPFLPHDGEKQWRWVDMQYRRHPWAVGDQAACASRAFPVLELPEGWKQRADCKGFQVATARGPSDSEGWQYAVDLYASDELWYADPTWFHCRRRLWRLEVEVAADSASSTGSADMVEALEASTAQTRRRGFAAFALMLLLLLLALAAASWYGPLGSLSSSGADLCITQPSGECSWQDSRSLPLSDTASAFGG